MNAAALAALMLFNTYVAEYREKIVPEARIFVGVQPGPSDEADAYAWTKCVPESKVFVTQAASKTLDRDLDKFGLRLLAAHEVCHVLLHGEELCKGEEITPVHRVALETEANICAIQLTSR